MNFHAKRFGVILGATSVLQTSMRDHHSILNLLPLKYSYK